MSKESKEAEILERIEKLTDEEKNNLIALFVGCMYTSDDGLKFSYCEGTSIADFDTPLYNLFNEIQTGKLDVDDKKLSSIALKYSSNEFDPVETLFTIQVRNRHYFNDNEKRLIASLLKKYNVSHVCNTQEHFGYLFGPAKKIITNNQELYFVDIEHYDLRD